MFVSLTLLALGTSYALSAVDSGASILPSLAPPIRRTTLARVALASAVSLLFFFLYVGYFVENTYSQIPYAIGGGKPMSVEFLFRSQSDKEVTHLVAGPSGNESIPYRLILETTSTYIVASSRAGEQAIQINRDAVAGYIVLSSK